jgi:HAE1 family hydrophobic/amphiphilic exporter-1
MNPVELTNWAEQTLKKRLENVRGVGSVTLVGGSKREINIYLNPQALDAFGITPEQVASAVRNENQDFPVGSGSAQRNKTASSRLRHACSARKTLAASSCTRKNGAPIRVEQVARVSDGAQEIESLALYNGQRTLLLECAKSQDENTIAVVDGLKKPGRHATQLPPGVKLTQITDGSRQIRVSVDNVRQTLIEGALLTILIVFLFLNSWRSTVITGLTLPIALIGTFFFMNLLGFTVNMITHDGAEPVRGPAD